MRNYQGCLLLMFAHHHAVTHYCSNQSCCCSRVQLLPNRKHLATTATGEGEADETAVDFCALSVLNFPHIFPAVSQPDLRRKDVVILRF